MSGIKEDIKSIVPKIWSAKLFEAAKDGFEELVVLMKGYQENAKLWIDPKMKGTE